MTETIVQGWTESTVPLKPGRQRDVKYWVYRNQSGLFLEIRNPDESPIHTLELPEGMKLERSSYEVLLRYVLLDLVAAA